MFFFKNNKRMWGIGPNAYFFTPRRGNSSSSQGGKDRQCNVSTVWLMGNLVIKRWPRSSFQSCLHCLFCIKHFTDTYGGHEFRQYKVLKNPKEVVWRKKKQGQEIKRLKYADTYL